MRYLRVKKDGYIFEWNPILAENPECEEVTEEQAYPERHIPTSQRGRRAKVDLTTENVPDDPAPTVSPELAAEASAGLPEGGAPNVVKREKV